MIGLLLIRLTWYPQDDRLSPDSTLVETFILEGGLMAGSKTTMIYANSLD
jgi:hypothetical protein